jgi:hypothetical protein
MSVHGVGDVMAVLLADLLAASRMHLTIVTIKVNGCHLILVNRVSARVARSSPAFGAKLPEEAAVIGENLCSRPCVVGFEAVGTGKAERQCPRNHA